MNTGIAIIGMAGRFPKAPDLDVFWRNLCSKAEAIRVFSLQELQSLGVEQERLQNPKFVPAGSCFDEIEMFDASFFGIPPREAEITDPQHRIFLECAWEALEDAGYCGENYNGAIGVYAGAAMNTYLLYNLIRAPHALHSLELLQLNVGNSPDFLTTRVSYKLNLRGPSHTVQTACSTSLVAVHVACQSLLHGESDIALAGGISINLKLRYGYEHLEGSMTSPDGHCRAFDASAQGTVFGSGVGIVVLKELDAALRDGDHIYAVIRGTAINNDGSFKIGYTAPSINGQAQVIREALANAGVDADSIGFVEAHGTGTSLGDPIEVEALTKAYRTQTGRKSYCALGSVKSNVGHLDAAAGVAGLIKAVLALRHQQIPPTLHFVQANPEMRLEETPFYVNSEVKEWRSNGIPRRAAVSAFGVGGTNAHVVLEEAPEIGRSANGRKRQLLVVSGRSSKALERATARLAGHLKQHPELELGDVAYTLQTGRKSFAQRRFVVCESVGEAVEALEKQSSGKVYSGEQERQDRRVVFLFPGQGSQYVGMGRGLYEEEASYREEIDRCAEILQEELKLDIREVLHGKGEEGGEEGKQLQETWLVQPTLFAVEYAVAQTWMKWGVEPEAMIGHSLGEYVAACVAGVFSLEEGIRLVARRGRMMQEMEEGAMLAVGVEESEAEVMAGGRLSVAAVNGPQQCVLSGSGRAVAELEEKLARDGITYRRLKTSHGFHSAMMEPMLKRFEEEVRKVRLQEPQRRYISNVSGRWIGKEEARSAEYWVRQLRETVQFGRGIRELLEDPQRIFLEVGPGQALSRLARQQAKGNLARVFLNAFAAPEEPDCGMCETLGRLWLAGASIDWNRLHAEDGRRRVPLPQYPFERQRYWIEPERQSSEPVHAPGAAAGASADLENGNGIEAHALSATHSDTAPTQVLHDRPQLKNPYVPPATEIEKTIAEFCRHALGIKEVGIDDNFFELGGDSLTALRVIADVRRQFGLQISTVSIYEKLTVRHLAQSISSGTMLKPAAETPGPDNMRMERMARRHEYQRKEILKRTAN
jgi:acyl transferase domain-containing protein